MRPLGFVWDVAASCLPFPHAGEAVAKKRNTKDFSLARATISGQHSDFPQKFLNAEVSTTSPTILHKLFPLAHGFIILHEIFC